MQKKTGLVIGRWQIYHNGHLALLQSALGACEDVIVVVGSAFRSRNAHNPFTWDERKAMILSALSEKDKARIRFLPVRDYYDDAQWAHAVSQGVNQLAPNASIELHGHTKDASSFYLTWFPQWDRVEVPMHDDVHATSLRKIFFEASCADSAHSVMAKYIPEGVTRYLEAWSLSPAYSHCRQEHLKVEQYRKQWTAPAYLTADAVVKATVDGLQHVLLVKRRKGTIGEGLWATPGGFVEPCERLFDAAVRELAEETGLKPLKETLIRCVESSALFDHPGRSPRGRLVSQAVCFNLGSLSGLPEVHGSDDVDEARWFNLDEVCTLEAQLFEDHATILRHFGLLPQ